MKIAIRNDQKKFKTPKELRDLVRSAVNASIEYMEFPENVEVSVMFTDNPGIHELNLMHRGIDRPTDVLSFPLFEYDEEGNIVSDEDDIAADGTIPLGDIVISLEQAALQAEEYGHTMEREVGFLTVHSMLHLFGYDHMTPDDEEEMFAMQKEILDEMGLER